MVIKDSSFKAEVYKRESINIAAVQRVCKMYKKFFLLLFLLGATFYFSSGLVDVTSNNAGKLLCKEIFLSMSDSYEDGAEFERSVL